VNRRLLLIVERRQMDESLPDWARSPLLVHQKHVLGISSIVHVCQPQRGPPVVEEDPFVL
jgi:hypothetical protein